VPEDVRVERPVNYGPTGSFTEAGSDEAGAIVFGEGLMEYEAYTNAGPARLGLTLLRCVGYLSREDLVTRPSGHAGPGLATPGAQCLGRHEFRAAFEPRQKPPTNAGLFACASSFVAPPQVVAASGAGGALVASGRFLAIDAAEGAVVLSACHRSEEGEHVQLRVFNPDPTPATMRVSLRGRLQSASRVDFLERPMEDLAVQDGAASVIVNGHGIATVVLAD
jgi:alpha-mannosidase